MAKIKICGLTDVDNAVDVAACGADAIGMVFYQPSPRNVEIAKAQEICKALPPFVKTVALFVNPQEAFVNEVIEATAVDLLQFHGQESSAFCAQFSRPYMKALSMRPDIDVADEMAKYADSQGILLDAYHPSKPGGTGESFDWQRFPKNTDIPLILAGGLSDENVAEAIRQCRPYAVDVSGGVESSHGYKSIDKVKAFINQVRLACSSV